MDIWILDNWTPGLRAEYLYALRIAFPPTESKQDPALLAWLKLAIASGQFSDDQACD